MLLLNKTADKKHGTKTIVEKKNKENIPEKKCTKVKDFK